MSHFYTFAECYNFCKKLFPVEDFFVFDSKMELENKKLFLYFGFYFWDILNQKIRQNRCLKFKTNIYSFYSYSTLIGNFEISLIYICTKK